MGTQSRFESASLELSDARARRWLTAVLALSFVGTLSHRLPFEVDSRWSVRDWFEPALRSVNAARAELHSLVASPASSRLPAELDRAALAERYAGEVTRLRTELNELRRREGLLPVEVPTGLTATVISRPYDLSQARFIIDRGSRDGVAAGAVVLAEHGGGAVVAGVVQEARERSSSVMSILDPECRIAVSVEGFDDVVVFAGGGQGNPCVLEWVDRSATIPKGAVVRTARSSSIFPGGIPVGIVRDVAPGSRRHMEITVEPYASSDAINYVWVSGVRE